MDTTSTSYKIHQCSKCPGYTEYYCESCSCNMCPQCKENHVKDLKTIEHNVMTYRDKVNHIPTQERCLRHEKYNFISKEETCVRHPNIIYRRYCKQCEIPACNDCQNHRKHKRINVRTAYESKRQQHEETIHTIRSDALFYRPVLLTGIKADEKTCHFEFSIHQSKMLTKAQKLKDMIDNVKGDLLKVFCDFDFKHRCFKQNKEMKKHIASIQRYIYRYEQSTRRPLQFLSLKKKPIRPKIHLRDHTSQLIMTESLNKEDVVRSLSGIKITERGKRGLENECLLKLMPVPEFHQSFTVTGVNHCSHISCVSADRAWVSERENTIMMTNTKGVSLHHKEDFYLYHDLMTFSDYYGIHTVNNDGELIYLDLSCNIKKLSMDMQITTTFIERTYSSWTPLSLHWSPFTRDLLVGIYRKEPQTSMVIRYNQSGKLTQIIYKGKTGLELYNLPNYITENNNGDVVVSDYDDPCGAVVVTERGGRHRFSYTGHPPESGLEPGGVCTDVLSNILVCDKETATVQILDRNGQFLTHLLTRPSGIITPCSLSYDRSTHRLWVGSHYNNKMVVYGYIDRQNTWTVLNPTIADGIKSPSNNPTTAIENQQQRNQCLLNMMCFPELIELPTVEDVHCCYHIACVAQDTIWVSDNKSNLILANSTGGTLHRVEDLRFHSYGGLGSHTVNIERKLIYIDKYFNIKKLSEDMKTYTIFIQRQDSTWEPQCVYSSQYSGDLLVAMYRKKTTESKVIRYNQSGKITQIIQHDNTGLELYSKPNYITENTNGDLAVCDQDFQTPAVVVTDSNGIHRFSYTGHQKTSRKKHEKDDYYSFALRVGSKFMPCGICTDALSQILICDQKTYTVHILSKDGQFLSYLRTQVAGIRVCQSLSYDVNTHRLWVGCSFNSTMRVYRYIDQNDVMTNERTEFPDGAVFMRPAWEWGELGYWQTTLPSPEEVYFRRNSKGTYTACTDDPTEYPDGTVFFSVPACKLGELGYWQTTLPSPEEVYFRRNSKGTYTACTGIKQKEK